jgi:3-keto-disaccharide hydrolase
MMHAQTAAVLVAAAITCGAAAARPQTAKPPKGFTSLFDGKDLTGWRGRQPNYDPAAEAKLSKEELAAKQAEWNAARDLHWKVDTAKGEIVSDGQSPHLATVKDYGDFEFQVEWLMVSANGDSGVYLRGYPQVQVWDPDNPREVQNGAPKGSGALWNDNPENPGKWPLVKADNPVGQWNTFKIKMVGPRVWVSLNDKVTVDGQVLDNFFDRAQPIVARGPIELQTHGSEIRFRRIYIREIPAAEAKATLAKIPSTPK